MVSAHIALAGGLIAIVCGQDVQILAASATYPPLEKMYGVNYGSRFVPEKWFGLYLTDDVLFNGISSGQSGADASLCDVGSVSDAGSRMTTFLDANIKQEHITKMASLGFNTIRLPLGYWNLIDLPAGSTPNGPDAVSARWQQLQNILPPSSYRKWIDQVFQFASSAGLKVLLDLHGAPGAQAGNAFSGCDIGGDSVYYWDTDWNKQLTVQSIEAMAEICAQKGSTCWGLELLNEPFGYNQQGLSRDSLKNFYLDAIAAARKHLSMDVPLVIMDWPDWLRSYWSHTAASTFSESQHGRVVFSTHMYQWPSSVSDLQQAEGLYDGNWNDVVSFTSSANFEVLITEYSLGSMNPNDNFDSNGFVRWMVQMANSKGAGSAVWMFNSYYSSWGPVDNQQVGNSWVDWRSIFPALPPSPPPTPPPTPPPSPTPPAPACPGGSYAVCLSACSALTGSAFSVCKGVCDANCAQPPTPPPSPPPTPTPTPTPSECPGGTLPACIAVCPTTQPIFAVCVERCQEMCGGDATTTPSPSMGMCCYQDCTTMATCLTDDPCAADEGSCAACSGIWCPALALV